MRGFVLILTLFFAISASARAERIDRVNGDSLDSNDFVQESARERDRVYDSHLYQRGDRYRTPYGAQRWRDRGRCNWCTLGDWHRAALRSGYARHSAYEGAADWHPTYRDAPRLTPAASAESGRR